MNSIRSFAIRTLGAAAVLAGILVSGSSPAHATTYTVGVYNTTLDTNLGLQFCSVSAAHACVESITINGVEGVYSAAATPQYRIAGGVYRTQCRFVETTSNQCEVPYIVVYPMGAGQQAMDSSTEIVLKVRRPPGTDPTARSGSAIVNGALNSFTPSQVGVNDVATVSMSPRPTEIGSSGFCIGWVVAVDGCDPAESATSARTNTASVLLLPGMRTSLVPPDVTDPSCNPGMSASACIVNVFDATSLGGWIDTDASIFGLASTDRLSGAAQLKISGPHYKFIPTDTVMTANPCPHADANYCATFPANFWGYTYTAVPRTTVKELNKAYFRLFMPTAYLYNSFGLQPAEANLETLPVKRALFALNSMQTTTYTPSVTGLLVSTTDITFSTPTMNVSRVLVVKKNKKVSATTMIRAAGLSVSKTLYGTPTITLVKFSGMKKSGSSYVFSKTSSYIGVKIKYKSATNTRYDRILAVKVKK